MKENKNKQREGDIAILMGLSPLAKSAFVEIYKNKYWEGFTASSLVWAIMLSLWLLQHFTIHLV